MANDFELSEDTPAKGTVDPALEAAKRSLQKESFAIDLSREIAPEKLSGKTWDAARNSAQVIPRGELQAHTTSYDSNSFHTPGGLVTKLTNNELSDIRALKAANLARGDKNPDMTLNMAGNSNLKDLEKMQKDGFYVPGKIVKEGNLTSVMTVFDPEKPDQVEAAKQDYGIGDKEIERLKSGEVLLATSVDKTRREQNGFATITYDATNKYLTTTKALSEVSDEAAKQIEKREKNGLETKPSPTRETFFIDKEGKEHDTQTKKTSQIPSQTLSPPTAMNQPQQGIDRGAGPSFA